MGIDRTENQGAERLQLGRPTQVPEEARSQRVVTFVTPWELAGLKQIAQEEERSLSAVVHRIIAYYLRNIRTTETEER